MEPKKALYTLSEASQFLNANESIIFAQALYGNCNFYVRVPDELCLYSVTRLQLFGPPQEKNERLSDLRMAGMGVNDRFPPTLVDGEQMLVEVDPKHYVSLRENKPVKQSVFSYGLQRLPAGTFSRCVAELPLDADALFSLASVTRTRRFATYHRAALCLDSDERTWQITADLTITRSELLLSREELFKLRRSRLEIEQAHPSPIRKNALPIHASTKNHFPHRSDKVISAPDDRASYLEQFNQDIPLTNLEDEHISDELALLRTALFELWIEALINSRKKLPSSKVVQEILEDQYGFSGKKAKQAAKIIKKSAMEKDSDDRIHLRAPWVEVMISHAAEWENGLKNPEEALTNKQMANLLKIECGFMDYVAEVVASIIRPEGAADGRKPKILLP